MSTVCRSLKKVEKYCEPGVFPLRNKGETDFSDTIIFDRCVTKDGLMKTDVLKMD